MIKIWREPEVVARLGRNSDDELATDGGAASLGDAVRLEAPIADAFWLVRPQMNGYNVHDGVLDEVPDSGY